MFLLDINVVSELRKKAPHPNVARWATDTPAATLYLSAVTVFELERGVLLLERRDAAAGERLRRWLDAQLLPAFDGRVLGYDGVAARRCAALHMVRSFPERDAMIAATALVHGMTVVTRDAAGFADTGVRLVDPWVA